MINERLIGLTSINGKSLRLLAAVFLALSGLALRSHAQGSTSITTSSGDSGDVVIPAILTLQFQAIDPATLQWTWGVVGQDGEVFINNKDVDGPASYQFSLNNLHEIPPLTPFTFQGAMYFNDTGITNLGPVVFGISPGLANPIFQTLNYKSHPVLYGTGAVQPATGAEISSRKLFSFAGARNWGFSLNYNSKVVQSLFGGFPLAQTYSAPMPIGWAHDFQMSIAPSGANLVVYWDEYRYSTFTPVSGSPGVFSSTDDATRYDTITAQTGGGWLLTHRDQSALLFNQAGLLTEDHDAHGRKLLMGYTPATVPAPSLPGGVTTISQLTSITEPISATSLTLAYDPTSHLLTTLTDATGAKVQFNYQVQNNLSVLYQIVDQDGRIASFAYDSNFEFYTLTDGQGLLLTQNSNTTPPNSSVATQTDARGNGFAFNYTTIGGQAATVVTDRDKNQQTHIFDSNYNELSFTNALSEKTSYAYDSANRITSVTDPLNRVSSFTYNSQGYILTATDPLSKVTTYTYDSRNDLLTATDPAGDVVTRTYDANNDLLTVTDSLNHTTTWTYNANSQPLTMTLPDGGVFTYAYTSGRVTQITDPKGVVTTFGYDANGKVLYTADALNNQTTYTYDGVGNVLTIVNGLNQKTTFVYDYHNRVTSITDPTGAVTSYTYDNDGNKLTQTDPLNHTTTFTYDKENRLLTKVDALNQTTNLQYDAAGQLIKVFDPNNYLTAFQYDAAGQVIAVVDPNNQTTSRTYDLRGLLLTSTDPLNRTTTFTYDAVGRRLTSTDPLNRQTNLAYDLMSRLTQVTDPSSLVASQSYDSDGNRLTLTNPSVKATAFVYDLADRLTSTTTPGGKTTSYTYDVRGLPLTVTPPSTNSTTFAYDSAMRMSSYTDPLSTVAFTRDADGRVLTTTEGSSTLTRVYDAAGRLTSYTDGAGNVFGYQYDAINRLAVLTYPGGKTVTYVYDGSNRLTTVTDWANRVTSYRYDDDGRVTELSRPDGSVQTYTYDVAGQLTETSDENTLGIAITNGSYTYDLGGQITNEAVTPSQAPAIPNESTVVDVDNRLTSFNGGAITYDANGNLLTVAGGATPASYTYDVRNRLTSAGGLTYTYNSENRRVSVTSSAGTTLYAINPNSVLDQVLVRTAPNGTFTYYVYGLGLLNEETAGVATFYHFDRLGNTLALTDINCNITGQVSYGTYGEITSQSGTITTPFLFSGRWGVQTDSNGIYFHRARYYHPQLRRFLNQDTILGAIMSLGSLNRFAYANGNPISAIDPFGTMAQDVAIGTTAGEMDYLNWALAVGDTQAENEARFALLDTNGNGFVDVVSEVYQGDGSSLSFDQRMALLQTLAASGYQSNQIGWPGQEAAYFSSNNPTASASDILAMMNGAAAGGAAVAAMAISSGGSGGLPTDLNDTLSRIANGEVLPFRNDGTVFQNREGLLPEQPEGYYTEYVHPTEGVSGPGPQRVVIGENGEIYYTPDHYNTFIPVAPPEGER